MNAEKPLLLLGVADVLVTCTTTREPLWQVPGGWDAMELVNALKKWVNVFDIRWCSVLDDGDFDALGVFELPTFPKCQIEQLTDVELKRPSVLLTSPSMQVGDVQAKSRHSLHIEFPTTETAVVVARVEKFLQDLSMTLTVKLVCVVNGLYPKYFGTYKRESEFTSAVDNVRVSGVECMTTKDQLLAAVRQHPAVQPHVAHLDHLPRGVQLLLHSDVKDANVAEALRANQCAVFLVFPAEAPRRNPVYFSRTVTPQTPLVWLAVSGVVSAKGAFAKFQAEYPDARQVSCASDMDNTDVYFSPSMVKRMNNWSWRYGVEIRWQSVWGEAARHFLAPMLGLLDNQTADICKRDARDKTKYSDLDLKRPFVWIAAELPDGVGEGVTALRGKDMTLLVITDKWLTSAQMDKVETFFAKFVKKIPRRR